MKHRRLISVKADAALGCKSYRAGSPCQGVKTVCKAVVPVDDMPSAMVNRGRKQGRSKSRLPLGLFAVPWPVTVRGFLKGKIAMYEFLQSTVGDSMTRSVRSVTPETTVADLYRMFAADGFEAYPVVRDDTLVGMVSKLDALKPFAFTEDQLIPHYKDGMATTVDEIMSAGVVAVEPEAHLQRVLELMIKHRFKSLPVVDERRSLLGIIAREDIMQAMERSVQLNYPPAA